MKRIIAIFCFTFWVAPALAQPDTVSQAIDTLKAINKNPKPSPQQLLGALQAIQDSAEPGHPDAVNTVFACIGAQDLASPVRAESLRVAIKLARNEQFNRLNALMRGIGDELTELAQDRSVTKPQAYYTTSALVQIFVEELPVERLNGTATSLADLFEDWVIADTTIWKLGIAGLALDAVAHLPLDDATKRRVLVDALRRAPSLKPTGHTLTLLSDKSARSDLRAMFRVGLESSASFHDGAASVLAHAGDRDILPALRQYQQGRSPVGSMQHGMLEWYIWQIETQIPPENLLEYIGSEDTRMLDGRLWAIERATQYGIDHAAIRNAILTHCRRYDDPDNSTWMALRPRLIETGLRLGVLSETDPSLIPPAKTLPLPPYHFAKSHSDIDTGP